MMVMGEKRIPVEAPQAPVRLSLVKGVHRMPIDEHGNPRHEPLAAAPVATPTVHVEAHEPAPEREKPDIASQRSRRAVERSKAWTGEA
jgi:hypothetical protein